jgi:hypothetical protein
MAIWQYIVTYIQPLVGIAAGLLIFSLVAYVNWYGNIKQETVKWIAKHIFRNEFRSEQSADGIFMTVTAFLIMMSGIWLILAFLYLAA